MTATHATKDYYLRKIAGLEAQVERVRDIVALELHDVTCASLHPYFTGVGPEECDCYHAATIRALDGERDE